MIAAALLLGLLPVGGSAGDGAPAWREVAPVPPEGAAVGGGGLDHPRGVERALSALALEHGDRARLWSYGRSADGRPLLALELHAERGGGGWSPGEGPTIFVVADLERDAADGVRDVVDWARRLLASDGALERARWMLLPAPAPDRLAGHESDVALAWDYPCGWDPWSTPGAGAYPLRAPETRALASAMSGWGTGVALVVLGAAERREGASLEAYARALGWEVLGVPAAGDGDVGRACGLVGRLALEPIAVRRLTSELWAVELRLSASADTRARGVRLEVAGARVLAAARRVGADSLPLPVDADAGTVAIAQEMSEDLVASLVVRGAPSDRVRVLLVGRNAAPYVVDVSLAETAASGGD